MMRGSGRGARFAIGPAVASWLCGFLVWRRGSVAGAAVAAGLALLAMLLGTGLFITAVSAPAAAEGRSGGEGGGMRGQPLETQTIFVAR